MNPSNLTVYHQMPAPLETLGGDVLLEVASWLSQFDLLDFVVTVRSLS